MRFFVVGLGRHDQLNGVLQHMRRNQDIVADGPDIEDVGTIENGMNGGLFARDGAFHDARQLGVRRVGHDDLHQEPVELRFGQRIRAFHFDRILRRHHQKRRLQVVGCRAARHGTFLHGFE